MENDRNKLSEEVSWKSLKSIYSKYGNNLNLNELFDKDLKRFTKYCKTLSTPDGEILFDFSKNLIDNKIVDALLELAKERKIEAHRDDLFNGKRVNFTENQPVLHTALRNRSNKPIVIDGLNIMTDINKVLTQMKTFVDLVRSGEWKGYTNKQITDIVNIGVGGSNLGPQMVTEALKPYGSEGPVKVHFVSNVDGTHLVEVLKNLSVETTLFLIVSKTFATNETMINALSAKQWFLENAQYCCDNMEGYDHYTNHHISNHFVAITSNHEKAASFGIRKSNVFHLWDWIVGRYSLWSSVGLSIALYIGFDNFEKLLDGANYIDEHFKTAELKNNIPVIMGLIGIWYNNFFSTETHAILPYDQYLNRFAAYFQQGEMESNGKSINRSDCEVDHNTGSIIIGEPGINSQNSFFQLIQQGTRLVSCDFIAPIQSHNPVRGGVHHEVLLANFLAQSESLMIGKTLDEVVAELESENIPEEKIMSTAMHKVIRGNNPSNSILLPRVTPFTLGAMIATYEHKTFVQGSIWDINSFDQMGLELGKSLAKVIEKELRSEDQATSHDSSTNNLINYIKEKRV